MSSRANQILDHAEREMRKGGPDAVSFRDIATAIGIKSASVHYHFPTKPDLTSAVVKRYAARFIEALGDPSDPTETPRKRLKRLVDAYIEAYEADASTCLCAVLGSVATTLPDQTQTEIALFFKALEDWTARAMEGGTAPFSAKLVVSLLQGAMITTLATHDAAAMEETRRLLLDEC